MKLIKLKAQNASIPQIPFEDDNASVFEENNSDKYRMQNLSLYISPKIINSPSEFLKRYLKYKNSEFIPFQEKVTNETFTIVKNPKLLEDVDSIVWNGDDLTFWHLPEEFNQYIQLQLKNKDPSVTNLVDYLILDNSSNEDSVPKFAQEYWKESKENNFNNINKRRKNSLVFSAWGLNNLQNEVAMSSVSDFEKGNNKELESEILSNVKFNCLTKISYPEIKKWLKNRLNTNSDQELENSIYNHSKLFRVIPDWTHDWFFNKFFQTEPEKCIKLINKALFLKKPVDLNIENQQKYIKYISEMAKS